MNFEQRLTILVIHIKSAYKFNLYLHYSKTDPQDVMNACAFDKEFCRVTTETTL